MNRYIFLFGTVVGLFLLSLLVLPGGAVKAQQENKAVMYFFWGKGCPHCEKEKSYITRWKQKYPRLKVRTFEVYEHSENQQLMDKMTSRFGIERSGVPMTFIGMRHWIGFRPSWAPEIESLIRRCLKSGCLDPGRGIIPPVEKAKKVRQAPVEEKNNKPKNKQAPRKEEPDTTANQTDTKLQKVLTEKTTKKSSAGREEINVPFVGTVHLDKSQPLWIGTLLIAFVDGFNPCSLWVLSLLLALVLRTESRKKTFIVGGTYLLITATAYGAFITGVFNVFQYVQHMRWIRYGVAAIALLFGLTNVKDFFAFKTGLTFSIPEKYKPKIYRGLRQITHHEHSVFALVFYTAAMALGITLVELPCTAGFPVIWNSFLTLHEVSSTTFFLLLLLYIVIYLIDEVAIFLSVVVTLNISQLEEKHGQGLKLFGGSVMVALAGVLIFNPHLMNNLVSALYVFLAALGASFALIVVRKLLPEVIFNEQQK